jgi:hypothetical protein
VQNKILFVISFLVILNGCGQTPKDSPKAALLASANVVSIPNVTLEKANSGYKIYRDGKPYFIRGGGYNGGSLDILVASGGNSIRTWSTADAGRILDEAQSRGLTVMLGLGLGVERHGFNYDDRAAVEAQKELVRAQVLKYKDHPALLAWGLGNELDLFYKNTNVWHAVEDLAKMIQELDSHHLVTTVVAGVTADKIKLIKERVPSIDYLSVNVYGDIQTLPKDLLDMGWQGAYAVTEWGPTGHWEIAKTQWNVPIEQTSTEKAQSYRARYQSGIMSAPDRSLGSYAFLWGQKQETTPTWYGLFLESGETTDVVDSLQFLWSGSWPEHRAPSINEFLIDGKRAVESIYVNANKPYAVKVSATHPNNEPFEIRWEILPESTDIGAGGDHESRPKALEGLVRNDNGKGLMTFAAPPKSGPYRLFVYVTTGAKKAAVANVPFYVR